MSIVYQRYETGPVVGPVATAQAIEVGDVCALVSSTLVRAEDFTWTTDLATTQTNFVAALFGISGQRKVATVARVPANGRDNIIRMNTEGVYKADLDTATTLVAGDFIGMAKAAGNALVSQTVTKVATSARAIGVCVEGGTSLTQATFKLKPILIPA